MSFFKGFVYSIHYQGATVSTSWSGTVTVSPVLGNILDDLYRYLFACQSGRKREMMKGHIMPLLS